MEFLRLIKRLLAGILAFIEYQKEDAPPRSTEAEKTDKEQSEIPPFVRASVEIANGVEVHKSETDTKKEAHYKFWTLFLSASSLVVAVLTLISLIVYAYISHGQLIEMRKTTRATQDSADAADKSANTAIASLRPWIKIQGIELRKGVGPIKTLMFHWPLTGATVPPNLQINVSMLNIGHSVAQELEVNPEFFFGRFQSDKWYDIVTREQERFCKSIIDNAPTGAARIAFPSDPIGQPMGIVGIVHDADTMHVPGNPNSYAAASIIICINYRGDGGVHYQAQARSSLYEDNQALINIGLDADVSRLRLIREPNGDHAN